jgi:diguanylate cyclase (GGDEF)-like protein/PAS domain S-box-containing protein
MLVDRSWALIGIHDMDGVMKSINPAIAESLRYPEEEIVGKFFGDFFTASKRQEFVDYLEQIKTQSTAEGRFRLQTKCGKPRVWEYRNMVIHGRGPTPFVLIHALDNTKRQVARNALKQSEERFKHFAEAAADWLWETDENMRIVYLSPRLEETTGVAPDRVLGETLLELTMYWNKELTGWREFKQQLDNRQAFRDFEFPMIKIDGGFCVMHISGTPFNNLDGQFGGFRGTGKDVTHEHQLTQRLAYQANRDPLTKLLNRSAFEQRVKQAVESAKAKGSRHAMCYIDLDQFKIVNDTVGHAAGDELLCQIANIFRRHTRGHDSLSRLGGDEFAILLLNRPFDKAIEIANQIVDDVRNFRFDWRDSAFSVSTSIGLVQIIATSEDVGEVIRQSDVACYMAKEQGRNRVYAYRSDDRALLRHDAAMNQATEFTAALDEGRFRLYCQPVMDISETPAKPIMYEVLLRLLDKENNIVYPKDFIGSAERYGLMPTIDRWVIDRTLQVVAPRIDLLSGAALSLNISGTSLNDARFIDFLHLQLDESNIPANRVYFEITENSAICYSDEASDFMSSLKKRGCRFVLDDFGSGLSAYRNLKLLPVDYLKIDGDFVRKMDEDPIDEAMVAAIQRVAQLMDIETIAECAESDSTLRRLLGMGIKYAQGNVLDRPKPFTAITSARYEHETHIAAG